MPQRPARHCVALCTLLAGGVFACAAHGLESETYNLGSPPAAAKSWLSNVPNTGDATLAQTARSRGFATRPSWMEGPIIFEDEEDRIDSDRISDEVIDDIDLEENEDLDPFRNRFFNDRSDDWAAGPIPMPETGGLDNPAEQRRAARRAAAQAAGQQPAP